VSGLDAIASLGAGRIDDGVAHQDALCLVEVSDLNPDATPVGDVLVVARSHGVKRLGGDNGDHASDDGHVEAISDVDTGRVVLGVAWLKCHGSVSVVEIEVEGLCGVNVVNADVVLLNPSGVRALLATEVVEGVIVDIILSALVIEVDLLLAVELTVALMLNLGR